MLIMELWNFIFSLQIRGDIRIAPTLEAILISTLICRGDIRIASRVGAILIGQKWRQNYYSLETWYELDKKVQLDFHDRNLFA